jgi:AAA domain
VQDTPRRIIGYHGNFNCDAFNNVTFRYVKTFIKCAFKIIKHNSSDAIHSLGLLYVPQRAPEIPPVEFRKTYKTSNGDPTFHAGQFYLRQSHESVPATTADDFRFLMNPQRLQLPRSWSFQKELALDNNIPARDGDLFEFVGRSAELDDLWRWFSDRYNPAKILTGVGGVGKTTIARAFAEQLVEQPPSGLEKVIWLSAKKTFFFVPTLDKTRPTLKVDFVDRRSMLIGLLSELGGLPEHLGDEPDLEELIDETATALNLFPSLIIVDDIDSLIADEQYEIFHLLLTITSRATAGRVSSRALLTSRLDLGAGSSRLIRVSGFSLKEFYQYVRIASQGLQMKLENGTRVSSDETFP